MISAIDSLGGIAPIMEGHVPVLAAETLEHLAPRDGGLYLDCTFGGGGHTELVLNAADCTVVGLDQDPQAVARAAEIKERYGDRFRFHRMNFETLDQLEEGPFDGILFDFGVSSFQLDEVDRGFSFRGEAPLDMRMNPEAGVSAAHWLATADRAELIHAIRGYAEEKNWRKIVDAILAAREKNELSTTTQLADLILSCTPARVRFSSKLHPATKVFQGIRIAINDEIGVIERGLPAAFNQLKIGGILCAISFHSLEDRVAKVLFRRWAGRPEGSRDNRPQDMRETLCELLGKRPITASDKEVAENPRSRSAKLRVLRKIK
ncbi:16S rRNA (cytosine(1402)-N(4))-methyltransferase RsmH [Pelagicoccus sp. SDUM812002]|uniref:16S rRNA (cytosine(1402)-N(4))-methyltransferase RsmH n=1 Tax=Pelagicoccus sp. SDUM812002 TaxID=3041266 RepID=UPI00280D7CB7|nr:16S rRNA (cytosine(1402)-N(4))-methyltransferase RsmH [Pelagicoccus sp. SDUM812002]MDQ8185446.1 16S rRNA (cytosine(1402)-N(4))-methyltransferase RsmH [Pelagicoccus sp. SDUM812002]